MTRRRRARRRLFRSGERARAAAAALAGLDEAGQAVGACFWRLRGCGFDSFFSAVDVLVTDPHGYSVSRTVRLEDETIEVD